MLTFLPCFISFTSFVRIEFTKKNYVAKSKFKEFKKFGDFDIIVFLNI